MRLAALLRPAAGTATLRPPEILFAAAAIIMVAQPDRIAVGLIQTRSSPTRACCRPTSGRASTLRRSFRSCTNSSTFWESSLDGRLHSVKIASARLIQPNRFRYASALMRVH
jgi:hypothetical protein